MKNIRYRNIFIDANVIIDYMICRKHHTDNANALFRYASNFSVKLHVCSYSFAIVYHYMRNENFSHNVAMYSLEKLFNSVGCLPVDDDIIKKAMKSDFRDFEDAIQYCCALNNSECEVIITRNPKDFVASNIPVSTPQKFLTHLLIK